MTNNKAAIEALDALDLLYFHAKDDEPDASEQHNKLMHEHYETIKSQITGEK